MSLGRNTPLTSMSLGVWPSAPVAAHGGAQPIVDLQGELVGRVATFTDDVLAVDIEPDHLEFSHVDLLLRPDSSAARER